MLKYIAIIAGLFILVGSGSAAWVEGTQAPPGPIAYGVIRPDGSVDHATPNVSSTWNATDQRYEITIAGENYQYYTHVTVASAMYPGTGATPYTVETASDAGNLIIFILEPAGTFQQQYFQFAVYKP